MRGDEFCHYWQDADGGIYVRRADADIYEQADKDSICSRADMLRAKANAARMRRAPWAGGDGSRAYTGTKRGLIILVEFTDMKFSEGNTRELYDRIANEEGFRDVKGFNGSVSDYFKAQSDGQFEMKFDVVGPVQMPNRYRYYGQDYGGAGSDRYVGKMIATACEEAAKEVRLSDYDWNGDGEADQVFVLYAGRGQASGGDANTIWPHEGRLSGVGSSQEPVTIDGIRIDTYACSCELGVNGTIDGIGTICHEFSHCFGLPDTYNKDQTRYGMFIWDIMDYGNYLDDSFTPAGYTSLERMLIGWRQPVALTRDTVITGMKPLSEGGRSYIIRNDSHPDEFYLLENRQNTGWDAALYGRGLLILHVNYDKSAWESNSVNAYSNQRCTIFHADNSDGKTDVADAAGDPYPYGSNNSLTNTSVPAATVTNANTDGSLLMNKQVTGITQNADGTISFRFGAAGASSGIAPAATGDTKAQAVYSIDGRYAGTDIGKLPHGVYVRGGKKLIR